MRFIDILIEDFYLVLYGITLIVALLNYRKYYDTSLKYLPILLVYTFFNELLGTFIHNFEEFQFVSDNKHADYNVIIYNIYDVFFFLYFYYLYRKLLQKSKYKKWIWYATFAYIISVLINPFIQDPLLHMQIYAYVIGASILVACIILHLTTIRVNYGPFGIHNNAMLWFDLGLLLFHLGYIPIAIMTHDYYFEKFQEFIHLRTIHLALIVIMYCSFIVGFLLMRKRAFR